MKTLLILFGGMSSEHEVSCKSAASLIPYIDRTLFDVLVVGITKFGNWYLTDASPDEIVNKNWEKLSTNKSCFLSPNRAMNGLQVIDNNKIVEIPIDVIFPVMHGQLCEDGAIQGLFELCGIPYVGSDICASACSMDKSVTKRIVENTGILQAKYIIVTKEEFDNDAESVFLNIEEKFGSQNPVFVKPASAGSSVGISKAHNRKELCEAFEKALKVCKKILVEETVIGREVEIAVIGNKEPIASCVGEVFAANEFYDFDAKYENDQSRTEIPANIPTGISNKLRNAAISVYQSLGCEGGARVDFFLSPDKEVVFNEINTLPGFTQISMYPKLFEASGIDYSNLITMLCDYAVERGVKM
ncbi:D-alanine--D-alanine ligase family protein [Butyrivibrio sp. AE2005]|uniref:D-alanine--D-alanine ligase family protein n=1 Tax=Butyrivibrio sp. AE2005 TaxID=1496722 RepID=UPI000478F1CB|nr:D-alanine--D-alanine ligase family protein [Butyrivibrio sp. AE2005]